MIKSKPWNEVDINDKKSFLSSKINSCTKNGEDIDAFSIIQDGNQGGNYYRIISWCGENKYCNVCFDGKLWCFDTYMKDFQDNKVVKYLPTNKYYKVVHSEMFYNILEKV